MDPGPIFHVTKMIKNKSLHPHLGWKRGGGRGRVKEGGRGGGLLSVTASIIILFHPRFHNLVIIGFGHSIGLFVFSYSQFSQFRLQSSNLFFGISL